MAEPAPTAPPSPVIDSPDAPVVYATELVGASNHQGDVNLTFGILQHDHGKAPPAAYRKVCLRLVLPRSALAQAHQFLGTVLAGRPLQEQGRTIARPN